MNGFKIVCSKSDCKQATNGANSGGVKAENWRQKGPNEQNDLRRPHLYYQKTHGGDKEHARSCQMAPECLIEIPVFFNSTVVADASQLQSSAADEQSALGQKS